MLLDVDVDDADALADEIDAEWDWAAEEAEVERRVNGSLRTAARLGVLALLAFLLVAGRRISADQRAKLLTAALRWADQFSGILAAQLTATTRRQVRDAIRTYLRTPNMTLADLRRLLLSVTNIINVAGGRITPGSIRAWLIALTEVTRAYIEAALLAARDLRISREPQFRPPLHVRCRCRLVFELRDDGLLHPIWWTAEDERVCPQCAPLHGRDVSFG